MFDKRWVIVRKNKAKIIEGYRYPMNGLWRWPLHDPDQVNQKSNMMAYNKRFVPDPDGIFISILPWKLFTFDMIGFANS